MVKWDLSDICKEFNDEILKKNFEEIDQKVRAFEAIRKDLNDDTGSEKVLEALKNMEETCLIMYRISAYASLKLSENTSDHAYQAFNSKIEQFLTEIRNRQLFFYLWWKDLDDSRAKEILKDLGKYAFMMESSRRFKKHTLNENEEKIIGLKNITGSSALANIYDIITNAYTFEFQGKKDVSREEVAKHVKDADPKIRKEAYDVLLSRYGENESALGEIYRGIVLDWINDGLKIRSYENPISIRNLGNNVPDEAVEALLNVSKKNIIVLQDYFKLKAKMIGVDKLRRYDVYAPLKDVAKDYKFDESKDIVLGVFKDFDEEIYGYAKRMFDKKHIHSDIQKGKRGGGFCSSVLPEIDPYILLNFVGKYNDVSTMAHELGHAVHDMIASDKSIFDWHSSLPLAETASIFSEMLLASNLLEKGLPKDEKIHLLATQLDGIYASIIRQAYFVIFEKKAHELIDKGATITELNDAYLELLKEQFGDSVEVEEIFKHEWKYIPHIYYTPFYCYAYAFGNLLVLALYKMYQDEGEPFIPKYKKILSYGGSESPVNILKEVGIDIKDEMFWQGGFDLIKDLVGNLKKELE